MKYEEHIYKKKSIEPSLLAADFLCLGDEVRRIYAAGFKRLHVDIMDGVFVPNISIGPAVLKSLKQTLPELYYDVHLMIKDPIRYIGMFADAGADAITVHTEAAPDITECINKIRTYGINCGLSIKPATAITALREYIAQVDQILVMSVEPGFGGQQYLAQTDKRIAKLRELMAEEGNADALILVDGGINRITGRRAFAAGADILVAGTWIFKNKNFISETGELLEEVNNAV